MNQFFISCKESRIENNRSFYGCFQLGPFEPSQSITIANALRRTLLSELYGLSIVSIEIEGATHEYSNLQGVKDSVLDILLNIKEIVLKKTINTIGIKPQIGYLKVRGPGLVRASNLILPPLIQCVDPDQYIATLTNDGFLNMKFVIQYSNKWLSTISQKSFQQQSNEFKTEKIVNQQSSKENFENYFLKKRGFQEGYTSTEFGASSQELLSNFKSTNDYNTIFNSHLKKRRLILKKLKQFGLKSCQSNTYINLFSKLIYKQSKKITNQLYPINTSSLIYEKLEKGKIVSPCIVGNDHPGPLDFVENIEKSNETLYPIDSLQIPVDNNGEAQIIKNTNLKVYFEKSTPWISYVQVPSIKLLKIKKIGKILFEESKFIDPSKEKKRKVFIAITHLMKKYRKKYPSINLAFQRATISKKKKVNNAIFFKQKPQSIFFNSNPLIIDAIFNPVTKVNYLIEVNDFKMTQNFLESSFQTSELFEILNISKTNIKIGNPNQQSAGEIMVDSDQAGAFTPIQMDSIIAASSKSLENIYQTVYNKNPKFLETLLSIKHDMNLLKKETPKHNIILEIWTNGSVHPRDAIYQAFKNLFKTFSKLNKVNTFMINPSIINSLKSNVSEKDFKNENNDKMISKDYYLKKIRGFQKKITSTLTDHLTLSPDSSNLLALDETNFLATYMSPKLKNYYLSFNNFKSLANNSDLPTSHIETNKISPLIYSKKISTTSSEKANHAAARSFDSFTNNTNLKVDKQTNDKTTKVKDFTKSDLDSLEINSLNLSLRSYTYLKRLNIHTISDLILFLNSYNNKKIDNNYLKLNEFGLEEINQSLKKLNLSL